MRLIFLCALVASAAFAGRHHSSLSSSSSWEKSPQESALREDAFRPGKEYRFHFDSQIASGLPVPGSQHALTRVQSLVSVVFPDERTLLLQIQKIRVGSEQKEVSTPRELLPFETVDEIELSEEHVRLLRLPVRVAYEKGLISEIEFDRDDQPWAENIKRAILNMLQVNMDKQRMDETEYGKESLDKEEIFFNSMERTLEGECQVAYTMVPEKFDEESRKEKKSLRVSKSLNFENCQSRVGTRYNFRFGDECPSCENKYTGDERNIESSTVLTYKIKGDSGSRFVIRETELRSTYVYAPLNQKEAFFNTFVNGRLVLVSVEEKPVHIPEPKSEEKKTLLYSQEWEMLEEKFLMEGDDSVARQQPYPVIKNKPELVARFVKAIVEKSSRKETGVELSATHEMARLVKVLRMCTKEELRRIHSEVCENSQEETAVKNQMRDIINDALALAGSYNTIEHLAEKMQKKWISPAKSAIIFKHLTNIRTPSHKMIEELLVPLCHELKRSPVERQSCWLTVGALVNGVCGSHRDRLAVFSEEKKNPCTRVQKEKYVREMKEMFEQSETRYEKILALKTMANSGMDMIVFPLEKIIKDAREEKTVRLQAIDALRQLRTVMPRKLQAILMPVYKNIREYPEIRVAAFYQIMQTTPERFVIDQITEQLVREPSQQVYSFVHSTLEQFARSDIACELRMAEDIKVSLKLARIQPRKLLSSRLFRLPVYSSEYNAGAALNFATLFANDSILPKEVMGSIETTFAGQWYKYLAQVGFSQQNIDTAIYKLAKKIEEEGIEQVLVRGKRAAFQPKEYLRDLFSKLSIISRKQQEEDPHALVYIRFRDLDFAVLPIDEEVIPDIIKTVIRNGRVELFEIEQILAKGYRFSTTFSTFVYERTRQIATSSGFPLVFTSKMPTIFKINGHIQAEIEPKSGKSIEGLKLKLKAEPTVASTHITKMEILSPVINHGVKLLHSAQANIPMDFIVEANWEKKWELKSTFVMPKEDTRIMQVQTRPVTFIRVWPKETRVYVEPKEKTIYIDELETLVHKIEESYFEKATGLKIKVDGHVHGHIFQRGVERLPSALIIGENNIELSFQKTEETPKEYVMKIELENFGESRMEKPQMESFLESDDSELFELEESEYAEEKESERRTSFKKYVKEYSSDKSYKHRVLASIKSVGGRADRMAELEVVSICDDKMRHCRLELNAERTPMMEGERKNWKLETTTKVLYPEMPETMEELLEQKHREVVAEVVVKYGAEEKRSLKIKIQGEQNKEQKKWMKRVMELKEKKETERLTALEEYSLLVEAAMLNQYKFSVKYENMENSLPTLSKLYSLIKYWAPFMNTDIEYAKNEPRSVRAVLTLEPETRQYLNLTIDTPRERVTLRDLRLPYAMRLVNIRRQPVTPIRSLSHLSASLFDDLKAECVVESRKVNTFDDLVYRTPLTTCYSVVAKDCSSEEKPQFAVLVKKVEKSSEEKKVKIITQKNVFELEKEPREDKIRVTINGKHIKEEEKLESYGVYLNGREMVSVQLEDLKVDFDGYTAQIKMSEYYKNKQCGLCGHYDGERDNEFRRADNEETEEIEEFHRSFLVKDDEECEIEEEKLKEKRNYRVLSKESSSSEESLFEERDDDRQWKKESKKTYKAPRYDESEEIIEPEERTLVQEFPEKVCFSAEPVNECPRKSYEKEDELEEKKIKFSCIRRSSTEASRLLRLAKKEVISVSHLPHSFTETIRVPQACVAY